MSKEKPKFASLVGAPSLPGQRKHTEIKLTPMYSKTPLQHPIIAKLLAKEKKWSQDKTEGTAR